MAVTAPTVKLTKGSAYLNINTGRYQIGKDFVPPPIRMVPQIASGTAANRGGNARKVGERGEPHEWSFTVKLTGSSDAEIARGLSDLSTFLRGAGDRREPLYLQYRPNSDVGVEPLWGVYGCNTRYEILAGDVIPPGNYMLADLRSKGLPECKVKLQIQPVATTKILRAGSALGRIHEDILGTTDLISRGLVVAPSITNEMTNPVFGHATFGNGWTADASLTASQNTLSDFLLPGQLGSAKLVSRATSQEYYQSINAGNTTTRTFICLIMLPDKGTPSSSDMQIFYNAALTTTFTDMGNGLWRASATAAGINAATNTGVQVKSGRTIYLLGMFMAISSSVLFYPFWGDNLGCAWSGTAHASTSTSVAGRWRLPVDEDTFEIGGFTIHIAVRWRVANTHGFDMQIFSMGAASIRAIFNQSGDTISFTDGTNTATSSAITFSEGTEDVFDFVASPSGGLAVYRNGVSIATSGTYTPPTLPSYLYLGTTDTVTNHIDAIFRDLSIYAQALTATEVLNNYTNLSKLTADGQRVSSILTLWTKDGDDVIDNHDDSGEDNWCVVLGVPGSEKAYIEARLNMAGSSSTDQLFMSNWHHANFLSPSDISFADISGTATTAADVGSAVATVTVDTSEIPLASKTYTWPQYLMMMGKEIYIFARLEDAAGSGLLLQAETNIGAVLKTEFKAANVATGNREITHSPPIFMPEFDAKIASGDPIFLNAKRPSGSNNVLVDFLAIFPKPMLRLKSLTGNRKVLIKGTEYTTLDTANKLLVPHPSAVGDDMVVYPSKFNMLLFLLNSTNIDVVITWTLTVDYFKVTPRWSLI